MLKRCTKCGAEKPPTREFFTPLKKGVLGCNAWCKPCMAVQKREYRAANSEKVKQSKKAYAQRNADKISEKNRRYREENADRIRANMKAYMDVHGERINSRKRELLATSPEYRARVREQRARLYKAHPERYRATRAKFWKNASPTHRLRILMGNAMRRALKGEKRRLGWQDVVGYTVKELSVHLERQFLPGMRWENYGEWHIDHIVPASSFSYTTPHCPDFKACWALTNLRPLWAEENLTKRAKRTLLL